MRIRLKPKRRRLDCDTRTWEIVKYLAHELEATIPEVVRRAVREFAVRRLDPDWEEVKQKDADFRYAMYKRLSLYGKSNRGGIAGSPVRRTPVIKIKGGPQRKAAAEVHDRDTD